MTKVPEPDGITDPVNEKAITADPPVVIINPFAAASPPDAFVTQFA